MTARYGTPPRLALVGRGVAHRIPARLLAEAAEVGAIPMALTGRGQGEEALSALRPADLLLRPERVLDVRPVEDMLRQRRVMVTGAGGSIGQALVMASLRCQPAEIIAYDNSEYNLYALGMALEDGPVKVSHRLAIGDVRDEVRLAGVMQAHPPDIVLHAAALKHVPLVEDNASEAVLTNVRGVVNVAMAAARSGAQRFVLISSDKAVSPTNTMGATKRLAERVLAGLAQQKAGMAVSVVRFGNVLGSSGSVVPRFEAQIRAGGPVTVSHPDATRYFMTIGEAANLVLQAAAQNDRRDAEASLFMLDMGQPMRVLELAETMIRLAGKHPYTEVPIVFSGQRAGDRLHEAIVRPGETAQPTVVDGLNRVHGALEPIAPDDPDLLQLFASAEARDERALMAMLRTLVPGFEGRCGDA
jgi:O-antigen biosynthesis protein WbqV